MSISYAADGTRSAFGVSAAANPTRLVATTFLVEDEAGTYSVEPIALGTIYLFSVTIADNCQNSEARC